MGVKVTRITMKMPTLTCRVCDETWTEEQITSLRLWEAQQTLNGNGCASCQAVVSSPLEELAFGVDGQTLTPWEETSGDDRSRGFWRCDGCGVECYMWWERDFPNFALNVMHLDYRDGEKVHYRRGVLMAASEVLMEPCEEPPHTIAGRKYCDLCATRCTGCFSSVFRASHLDPGDPYLPGASMPHPDHFRAVCVDCYEDATSDYEE